MLPSRGKDAAVCRAPSAVAAPPAAFSVAVCSIDNCHVVPEFVCGRGRRVQDIRILARLVRYNVLWNCNPQHVSARTYECATMHTWLVA